MVRRSLRDLAGPGIVAGVTESIGQLAAINRYPVKSLVGEELESAGVDHRGLQGDRLWAVLNSEGTPGSGKNTRRFTRMPGLLELAAAYDDDQLPVVSFPDGRRISAADPTIHQQLSAHVGLPVTLGREAAVSHFDEAALHLVTTSSLAALSESHGAEVDRRRFRANLVLDSGPAPAFVENDWIGRELMIGPDVRVRVRRPMVRCVMVDLPQRELAADGQLLKTVARVSDMEFGLVLDVLAPGTLRRGDLVTVR
jgi:uncharacterized protein YcbX